MDKRTGMPADNNLASVTVIAENGAMADAYATALSVMGEESKTLAVIIEAIQAAALKVIFVCLLYTSKRAIVEEGGVMEWVSGSFGSHTSYLYPMTILKGKGCLLYTSRCV